MPDMTSIASGLGVDLNDLYNTANANSALSETYAQNQRAWSEQMQQVAMDFNASEAEKNRNWQELMSNTAHQREVRDLLAAGLNPVLSAGGGNGAAVGSGAQASVAIPSGSTGQVDTSKSSTVTQLLLGLLGSVTNIANTATSANATLGAANLASEANRYAANQSYKGAIESAAASRYGSTQSSSATRYAADQSAAASRYGSDANANTKNSVQSIIRFMDTFLPDPLKDYRK